MNQILMEEVKRNPDLMIKLSRQINSRDYPCIKGVSCNLCCSIYFDNNQELHPHLIDFIEKHNATEEAK